MTTETALLLRQWHSARGLCWSCLICKDWKAQKPGQRDHLKKAKPLDGLLRDRPRPMKQFALLAVAALAFAVLAWQVAPDYVSSRRHSHRTRRGPRQLAPRVAARGAAAKAGRAGAVKMVSACHTPV